MTTCGYTCNLQMTTCRYTCNLQITTCGYTCNLQMTTCGYTCNLQMTTCRYTCNLQMTTCRYTCNLQMTTCGYTRNLQMATCAHACVLRHGSSDTMATVYGAHVHLNSLTPELQMTDIQFIVHCMKYMRKPFCSMTMQLPPIQLLTVPILYLQKLFLKMGERERGKSLRCGRYLWS